MPVNIIPPSASPNRASKTISIRSTIESTAYDVSYYTKFNILSRDCLNPLLSIWFEDTDFGGTNDTNSKYLSVYHNGSLITECGNNTNTCGDTKWCLQDYAILNLNGSFIAKDSQFVILLKKGWNSSIPSSGACDYSVYAEVTLSCTGPPTSAPTTDPTSDPTNEPTFEPTTDPTTEPTMEPSDDPTLEPTANPSSNPTTPAPILIDDGQLKAPTTPGSGSAISPNSTNVGANENIDNNSASYLLSIILGVIGGVIVCVCIIVGFLCFRYIRDLKQKVATLEAAKAKSVSVSAEISGEDDMLVDTLVGSNVNGEKANGDDTDQDKLLETDDVQNT